jgi:tRNA nucleotidyltransferase/poly(A) polymerase
VEEILADAGFRTLPTGKAFGVINVFTDGGEYEIATFREDLSGGRRPDAVKFTDIESDVKRRDLTINALFYDIDNSEIVDLVGGVDDLKKGIVKTVGSPQDRFSEDRLRILRAIRFAARFGSDLDPEVDAALRKDASLDGISGERIRDEFLKGIKSSKSTTHLLKLIERYGLFSWIFKGLKVGDININDNDPILVISYLLKDNDPAVVNKQLNVLKYTVEEIKAITFLISLLKLTPETAVQLKRMQKNAGVTDAQINSFGSKMNINSRLLNAFINFKLTINGEQLMQQLNLKPGKELGDAINKAEYENFKKLL